MYRNMFLKRTTTIVLAKELLSWMLLWMARIMNKTIEDMFAKNLMK